MPAPNGKTLLKMPQGQRWQTRMNAAWHDMKKLPAEKLEKAKASGEFVPTGERPDDARLYTDRAPQREVPDESRPAFADGTQPVKRERILGVGVIQIWRPGEGPEGALTEVYNGEDWHGFKAEVDLLASYEDCMKAIRELLGKFEA